MKLSPLAAIRNDIAQLKADLAKAQEITQHVLRRTISLESSHSTLHSQQNIPLPIKGIDYSDWRPTRAELHATGAAFVVRYLCTDRGSGKLLTRAEARELHSQGVKIATVFEDQGTEWRPGTPLERIAAMAEVAAQRAREAGQPELTPIYGAIDYEIIGTGEPEAAAIQVWKTELAKRHYLPGIYGGLKAVQLARQEGIEWLWQTIAWSHGQWGGHNQIRQTQNGTNYDHDLAMVHNYGGW